MRYILAILSIIPFIPEAHAVNATGNATVEIQKLITISEDTVLDFGSVYSSANAGDVTLTSAGVMTSTSSTTFGGTPQVGVFSVSAEPNTPLNVTFSNSTLTGVGDPMTLDQLVATSTPASNTTDANGDLSLNVGGRLSINPNQASGTYTGTYSITVNY